MKKILTILAITTIAFGTSQALAATQHHAAPKTLIVAMHDPGCHWFYVHGKFLKSLTVRGAVRLVDKDEAALKIASKHGMLHVGVNKSLVLRHGTYVVMMVHQAVDDNYLKLTVK